MLLRVEFLLRTTLSLLPSFNRTVVPVFNSLVNRLSWTASPRPFLIPSLVHLNGTLGSRPVEGNGVAAVQTTRKRTPPFVQLLTPPFNCWHTKPVYHKTHILLGQCKSYVSFGAMGENTSNCTNVFCIPATTFSPPFYQKFNDMFETF